MGGRGLVRFSRFVQPTGDMNHRQIDVIGRQVVHDRIEEAINVGLGEFLRRGKVGGDAALLGLGVED